MNNEDLSKNQKSPEPNSLNSQKTSNINTSSGTYNITANTLEELMSFYKERGSDYRDLKQIEKLGGIDGILEKLKTNSKTGISSDLNRLNDFGSNKVFVEPVPPFCSYVWEALEDLMIRILIIAAIVQIVLGATLGEDPSKDWVDGLSIVIAVLVVTLVGSITNWKKENKFHELNDIQNEGTKYKVIRNGNPNDISSDDLLVGDLVFIMVGDILPADLLEVYDKCIESLKNVKNTKPPSPLMLSGTFCIEGTGSAIVIAVGDHSQKGIIRRTVDNAQENAKTPLEEKLEDIAEKIGYFGMAAGIITLVALFIRFGVSYVSDMKEYKKSSFEQALYSSYLSFEPNKQKDDDFMSTVNAVLTNPKKNVTGQILDIIMLCVSIIVVAIPEGLPLAVTLSLAFSIKKLMDQQNLVRKMHPC